jgi:hypothetical protein
MSKRNEYLIAEFSLSVYDYSFDFTPKFDALVALFMDTVAKNIDEGNNKFVFTIPDEYIGDDLMNYDEYHTYEVSIIPGDNVYLGISYARTIYPPIAYTQQRVNRFFDDISDSLRDDNVELVTGMVWDSINEHDPDDLFDSNDALSLILIESNYGETATLALELNKDHDSLGFYASLLLQRDVKEAFNALEDYLEDYKDYGDSEESKFEDMIYYGFEDLKRIKKNLNEFLDWVTYTPFWDQVDIDDLNEFKTLIEMYLEYFDPDTERTFSPVYFQKLNKDDDLELS